MKRFKIFGIFITAIVFLVGGIILYMSLKNTYLSNKWLNSPAPPGKLFKINNHEIYATIKGNGNRSIVIETALGSSSPEWWEIQDELSKYAKVITYDRPGYGWSMESPKPRTSENVAMELMELLKTAEVKGPYIIVGHALGGLYMQHFAKLFSNQIAAVILVDPLTVGYYRFKKELDVAIFKNLIDKTANINVAGFLSKIGIIRSLKVVPYLNYNPEIKNLIIENYSQSKTFKTMYKEYKKNLKISIKQIMKLKKFPGVPLIIIHHSPEEYKKELKSFGLSFDEIELIENISLENHKKIISQVPGAKIIYSSKSKHNIHFDDPGLIINTVKEVIK